MRSIVAGQVPVSALEFTELALGVDADPFGALFAGVAGESASEWAARMDVAREVLAELRETDPESAAIAADLMRTAPIPLHSKTPRRRAMRSGVAA